MPRVIFTDDERKAAKDANGKLFVYLSCLPENQPKDGTFKTGVLADGQADDLDDAVMGQLRKFKAAAANAGA